LRYLTGALKEHGIVVERDRAGHDGGRIIAISKRSSADVKDTPAESSAASANDKTQQKQTYSADDPINADRQHPQDRPQREPQIFEGSYGKINSADDLDDADDPEGRLGVGRRGAYGTTGACKRISGGSLRRS
jgi:hypothetical protein